MSQLKSYRDEPGTAREYETVFILRPDTSNESVGVVNTRLRGIVDSLGGRVLKLDNWGKRKLAYEVKKELRGIYLYWQYLGTSGLVAELERNLRMLDSVIRYTTVKIDADVDPNARPSDMTEETWAKAAVTAADEEELMSGASRFAEAEAKEEEDDVDVVAGGHAAAAPTESSGTTDAPATDKEEE